jgi:serine protease AprX
MIRKGGAFGVRGRALGAALVAASALVGVQPAGAARAKPVAGLLLGTKVTDPSKCGSVVTNQSYDASADGYSLYNDALDIGADTYYNAGKFGQGIDVALVDSGVAPVAGLTNNVIDGPDYSFESQAKYGAHANPDLVHNDSFGHGTHMGSIIAGADGDPAAISSRTHKPNWQDPKQFYGIAPKSRLVSVKVADSGGVADVTQVVLAIDWVVQHRHDNGMNIRVLNLSYGFHPAQDGDNSLTFAVQQAWKAGIVVVAADGNGGSNKGGLLAPASDNVALAVGSYDDGGTVKDRRDDNTSEYSQKGLHRSPDVVAPGAHVLGLHDIGSAQDGMIIGDCAKHASTKNPWYSPVFGTAGRFVRGSGTSQAAAVASGVVALMLSQNPNLTPEQVRGILRSTARDMNLQDTGRIQGKGEIDAASAFNAVGEQAYGVPRHVPYASGLLGTIQDGRPIGDDALICTNDSSVQLHSGGWNSNTDPHYQGPCALAANAGDTANGMVSRSVAQAREDAVVNVDMHAQPFDPRTHALQSEIDAKTGTYVRGSGPLTVTADGETWNRSLWTGEGFSNTDNPLLGRPQWQTIHWRGNSWLGDSFNDFDWTGLQWRNGVWEGLHLRGDDWMTFHLRGATWQGNFWADNTWS